MKKFLLLVLFFGTFLMMNAQTYYDTQWKTIEQNAAKGLYKSNLPIILEIQKRAVSDNNAVQLIRSLKAEFSIVNQTKDDTQNDSVSKFFAKLKSTETNLKGDNLLLYKVLLNEFFSEYYQNNAWKINQRTNINNEDFSQIETWSKLDFKNFLSNNFSELDKQNSELRNVKLANYKAIFSNIQNLNYFPTLADWNAMQQISFFKNAQLLTPNEIQQNQPKIGELFNQLISQNSGNAKLYFQHQKLVYDCGVSNCKDRFAQLQNLYDSGEIGDYKLLIANEMSNELINGKKYSEALILIKNAKKQYPESPFLNNIKNTENSIINPSLNIYYETETQSGKPIHLVAQHKNLNQFSVKIYEVTDAQVFMNFVQDNYKYPFSSLKKNLVRTENFDVPDKKDFQTYNTSLEIKPLPSGIYVAEYIVENAVQKNFYFIASENRIIDFNKSTFTKNSDIQKLVNRENGKEISNQNIEFFEFLPNKPFVKYSAKTGTKGEFSFPESSNKNYYRTYLMKSPGNNFQIVNRYGNQFVADVPSDQKLAQIFTDRAIYRPGQMVYFKVTNTKLVGEKESVNPGISQKISLLDANGEEVSAQNFNTNEFGSYSGNFILPKGKLNGNFSLRISDSGINSYKNFSVEEYKRPNFEVSFEPVKSEYKYGETLILKGKATTFSGVPLSNATVNYEIKKRNIRWMYFGWLPRGNDNENSILSSVKTDEKGDFLIKVDLKKDEKIDGIQVDNYEINTSVTDINGETQSAVENVKVASVSHYFEAENVENSFSDESVKLKVETKNYSGQNLQKSYQVKLEKLQEPQQIFRENFRSRIQDLPKFSKEEFLQKFPHDYFDKTDLPENWKAEKLVVNKIQQPTSGDRQLDLGKLEAGTYRLNLYNIEGKDTIKSVQQFQIWDKKSLKNLQKPFLEIIAPKEEVKRDERAKIYVYSAVGNSLSFGEGRGEAAVVNVFLQNGNGETKSETLKMNENGVLAYDVLIPNDEKISQLNLQFQIVAFNDVQTKTVDLKIKNEKENLRIETVTFRDKILPNSKEKWSVKILGSGSEKINAEVLANMYDMSLDQFAPNKFEWQNLFYRPYSIDGYDVAINLASEYFSKRIKYLQPSRVVIPQFNWFDGGIYGVPMITKQLETTSGIVLRGRNGIVNQEGVKDAAYAPAPMSATAGNRAFSEAKVAPKTETPPTLENLEKIPVRQNLNETAFFYPNLTTDKAGNVNFEFTSPEALTKWKLMFLAHTKDARAATLEKEVVTQKDFSVTPNYPRFLREGDELNLQSKLNNLTAQQLNGSATLQILDAFTNEDISGKFNINNSTNPFELNANGTAVTNWKLKVPNGVSSIIIKVVANTGKFSDGEQKAIPVLPNRILVTDAQPIFVKEGQTKTFVLKNLAENNSKTVTNFSNTLELTTNPIWEILFALPSLKDDPNLSADVQLNKWFADVLASEIFKANPKMKTVFDEYQNKGLLTSNLEKNQELKQLLLEETPWVLESKNETEQMQKLARLFDANTMRNSIRQDWDDLKKLQNPDGGFSWYVGYPSSYSTSLYILKSLGKINEWLKGNVSDYQDESQNEMVSKLINYIDSEIDKTWKTDNPVWTNSVLDYLDSRHYWESKFPLKNKGAQLKNLVIQKAPKADIKDFTFFGLHRAALLFDYYKLTNLSKKLLTYLKETSTATETQGVYWKQNLNSWGWYSSKTVNHAGALEAFEKLSPNDVDFIEEMKIWLVTQKEVSSWDTSRSTAEVIFTILNSGKSWTGNDSDSVNISWNHENFSTSAPSPSERAGERMTGYFKKTVISDKIDKNMASVTVTKPGAGIAHGGLFWQYYENLDQVKSSESYISITKEIYKKIKTANGEELQKITAQTTLKVGDKVTVRMILNTDRNMEFIHLKDMRAAGFEPLNVLSGYQWKNNLGYYQSTKDASTNFYIQYMPKGKYVFEYDLICNASGTFSGGFATLQNYYAPQMNARTAGSKVIISE